MPSLFERNILNLKGVGDKRAKLFCKLGVPTVGALLRFYPRNYEDWSNPCTISEAPFNEVCTIRATVLFHPSEQRIRKGMTLYKVRVTDSTSDMVITYFNNPYIMTMLAPEKEYLFYGKVGGSLLHREMSVPEFAAADKCPTVFPIYRQTEGLSSKMIANAVKTAFDLLPETIRDPIPENIRKEQELCSLRFALTNIHFPKSMQDLPVARKRLVFEELLVLQLGLLRLKGRTRAESSLRLTHDDSKEFFALLPFVPTNAQCRAVSEAILDMQGKYPMSRLIQGDVGSGKTAVAAALCYCVIKCGMQAALMAPTEILAQQHYRSLEELLSPAGIHVALLTGSVTAAKRRILLEQLKIGEIQLLIGTHALLSDGVEFRQLGLVVTDEQHRFGVAQRAALTSKGNHPHMLIMSATPIPRTLALMIYGDLDLSVLDELPPGRQKIETYAISSSKRTRAFHFLHNHIDAGQQCYVICPLIDEGQSDMASVQVYTDELRKKWFPNDRIAMLHGKMKPKEKEAVMSDFSDGKIDILVSTTVVEVGVDVPNATVMLIENAERYGLSQLHQLRGRVGRGKVKSTCILVSDAQNEEATSRLHVMCETGDGFRIADEDLRLRGPGDFFGARQHGLPELKIADMVNDMELLKQAQSVARAIVAEDESLALPNHRGLRAEVNQLFGQIGQQGLN